MFEHFEGMTSIHNRASGAHIDRKAEHLEDVLSATPASGAAFI
jgi:hypothetical protein